ncbi:MAG: hypothetical protein B7Y80_18175 [Hyphomicrobium sp. 32-62-53]|jgi:hypothetical protein|nr:MAG: hypothetical protein B7Z29_18395 [Hyphomicrobium sp. 12-62-95]OYX97793.1 MAG: hypothetical protein B7Y80_18175 [Hyphomicrobium sp. 32-62-53]
MTRNQKSLVFVASGGTYDEAATQFKRTRGVGAGLCHRAGLKVGTRYPDRNRDNGRRQMESLRTRAHCDPILRAKWITAINDGRASWRDGRTAPYNVRGSIAHGSEHRRNRL